MGVLALGSFVQGAEGAEFAVALAILAGVVGCARLISAEKVARLERSRGVRYLNSKRAGLDEDWKLSYRAAGDGARRGVDSEIRQA